MRMRILRAGSWGTRGGLAALAIGAAILAVMSTVESLTHPGTTLVDGYFIGPLPWTPIGVGLVLAGSTITVVAASALIWAGQGWLPRAVTLPALVSAAGWWALSPFHGMGGSPRGAMPGWDPITIAYSIPDEAFILLVVPAVVLACLALYPVAVVPAALAEPRGG